MRILFTIPHYFRAGGDAEYGSTGRHTAETRAQFLAQTIAALATHFGGRQVLRDMVHNKFLPANTSSRHDIDIVIRTVKDAHVLNLVGQWKKLFQNDSADCEPHLLGFSCHETLKSRLGQYDYYCYIEDDSIITDALFFDKLAWFVDSAGETCVLQANRYSRIPPLYVDKIYLDGDFAKMPDGSATRQAEEFNLRDERMTLTHLGRDWTFVQCPNQHAGSFFLTERQMRHWASQPYFLERDTRYAGPLESAATLGLLRTFRSFKAARENAHFLEFEHIGGI
jgi:hypothetical protein